MTSLVSHPQINLSLTYDCRSSDSLYKVWKFTRDNELACLCSSTLRLNNRSWRLLNERLLHRSSKNIDNSYLNLADLDIPQKPSPIPETLEATKVLQPSLPQSCPNGDDRSGVSERACDGVIDGETPSNYEEQDDRAKHSQGPLVSSAPKEEIQQNFSREVASLVSDAQSQRLKSASDPKNNIFFIANTPSPENDTCSRSTAIDKRAELTESVDPPVIKRQDSLFGGTEFNSTRAASQLSLSSTDISEDDEYYSHEENEENRNEDGINLNARLICKSERSQQSAGDESEWLSVSSESESNDAPPTQPLNFPKRIPIVSRSLADSKESTSLSDSKRDSPSSFRSKSLLSGLFLSDLASRSAAKSPSDKLNDGKVSFKPVLKRSSTTGLMSLDKSKQVQETTKLQKPSILYSRRFASLSDVTKNPADYRSPVLFIEEEDNMEHPDDTLDEEHLYTKQASSVSLSNFKVTAHGMNSISTSSGRQSPSPNAVGSLENAEALLSSSLNKYSNLHSVASLKNIFSKSSLHLTNLFGQAMKARPDQLRTTLSSESLKFQKQPLPSSKGSASNFAALESQSPQFSKSCSGREFQAGSNDGSSDHTEPAKIDVRVLQKDNFEPSVEISESLRNSLLIDHKLGKIPKPERVISDEFLLGGQGVNTIPEENYDYHSKGW